MKRIDQLAYEDDSDEYKIRALRNAVLFLSTVKTFSVFIYVAVYFVVRDGSPYHDFWPILILVFIQLIGVLLIPMAILLVLMGFTESSYVVIGNICFAAMIALIEMFLGIAGTVFYIRYGYLLIHHFLATVFFCIAISNFPVFADDWYLVCIYGRYLNPRRDPPHKYDSQPKPLFIGSLDDYTWVPWESRRARGIPKITKGTKNGT